MLNQYDMRPRVRRGMGDSIDDLLVMGSNDATYYAGGANNNVEDAGLFGFIADFAQGGQGQMGELSDFLVRTGYTIEVVRNALQNIAAVGAPAPVIDYAAQELRYLNSHPGAQQPNNGLLLALGGAALLLILLSRRGD